MPIPQNKKELLTAIEVSYQKLRLELESIPEDLVKRKQLEGHAKDTMMSIANLVSYLIGWGKLVLKWHTKKEQNEPVDFPETGYKWNQLGQLAQKFYQDYAHLDYPSLLEALDQVVSAIRQLVINTSNQKLYHQKWYEKWPLGKMIQLNTSSPYKNAKARIRKWKKSTRFEI